MFASRTAYLIFDALKGEYHMSHFNGMSLAISTSKRVKQLIASLMWLIGSRRIHYIIKNTEGDISLQEYLEVIRRFEQLKNEFVDIYQDNHYDAIIAPVVPIPPFKHTHGSELLFLMDYTMTFNLLDFPAGVIPIRKSRKSLKRYEDGYNDFITRRIRENLEDSQGLPIGIQVATISNKDEACLAIMDRIDRVLKAEKVIEEITV